MADEPKTRALGNEIERIAVWRQGLLENWGPTGAVIGDIILADAEAVGRFGKHPPAVETIAERARVCVRTVQYKLKSMEQKGFIARERVGGVPGEGRQQENVILPTLPEENQETGVEQDPHDCIAPARAGPKRNSRSAFALRLHLVG